MIVFSPLARLQLPAFRKNSLSLTVSNWKMGFFRSEPCDDIICCAVQTVLCSHSRMFCVACLHPILLRCKLASGIFFLRVNNQHDPIIIGSGSYTQRRARAAKYRELKKLLCSYFVRDASQKSAKDQFMLLT